MNLLILIKIVKKSINIYDIINFNLLDPLNNPKSKFYYGVFSKKILWDQGGGHIPQNLLHHDLGQSS
jgi:hypothetical protein